MKHLIGKRVEIPPHADEWMQGDRYGRIVHTWTNGYATVELDKSKRRRKFYIDSVTFI